MVSAPDHVCGYTPDLPDNWEGDQPIDSVTFAGEYVCTRQPETAGERCIWHSRRHHKHVTEEDITGDGPLSHGHVSETETTVVPERIDDAYLPRARFNGVDLDFQYFYNAHLPRATYTDTRIGMSQFVRSNMEGSTFTDCVLGSEFHNVNLGLSEFRRTEFTGSKFIDDQL